MSIPLRYPTRRAHANGSNQLGGVMDFEFSHFVLGLKINGTETPLAQANFSLCPD
jgi:hypothetical protein